MDEELPSLLRSIDAREPEVRSRLLRTFQDAGVPEAEVLVPLAAPVVVDAVRSALDQLAHWLGPMVREMLEEVVP